MRACVCVFERDREKSVHLNAQTFVHLHRKVSIDKKKTKQILKIDDDNDVKNREKKAHTRLIC